MSLNLQSNLGGDLRNLYGTRVRIEEIRRQEGAVISDWQMLLRDKGKIMILRRFKYWRVFKLMTFISE